MKHLAIVVSGRVQGVFYRASAKEQADVLGIKGFVRNEPNGNVFIEAQGDDDSISKFVEWCRKGPKRAEVDSLMLTEKNPEVFDAFEIRR